MVLIDKGEVVTDEENSSGDEMLPLEEVLNDDDDGVYVGVGGINLVVIAHQMHKLKK